jgi:ABC-type transport system involved in cytochrome c biogenesis permease component
VFNFFARMKWIKLYDAMLATPLRPFEIALGELGWSLMRGWLYTFAFLAVAELVALPAFALFFSPVGWSTVAGVLLADLGICAVGTLLAAMAAAGRARELLLPLLFLPLALPIVIGGVGASVVDSSGRYLGFLALYDAIFALLAWASFEYVVTE